MMHRQGEVLVAFEPDGGGGGSVFVYGDPFEEQRSLPVEILVSPYSTRMEVVKLIGDVMVAWGFLRNS